MRHFAENLRDQGYQVHYVALDDPFNTGTLYGEINRALVLYNFSAIIMTFPGEYRILQNMLNLQEKMPTGVAIEIRPDNRFLCTQDEFEN